MSVTKQLSMSNLIKVETWTATELALIEIYSQSKSFGDHNERALALLLIKDGGIDYDMHWGPNRSKQDKEGIQDNQHSL
jgi:hypothetical protein